ncbi:MAG: four helix bundle protein [Candidatus Marinimicrobia bacterium]|nr:four helix bundle protein [Candidatus Neomarinimicrobiota bacterium]MCF7850968.1 four helix bundle protein [Candidatus Neomarinimicrobiota bacterium]MCF7905016.1 four helix bundle protein [Candidatus Neomarinimicrobiota bacterium]
MKEIYSYDVYILSEQLSDRIWTMFDTWDRKAKQTMGYQMIRSADSISANLAEGFGRYSFADKKRFYRYSRGSFEETKAWLRKAYRRRLISEEEKIDIQNITDVLGPKLNSFISKTGA